MPVYVDVRCGKCDELLTDVWSTLDGTPHSAQQLDTVKLSKRCEGILERVYTLTPAPAPGTHMSERCVVYVSQQEGGKIQYPANNTQPVPERLQRRGYERVEIHAHQMGAFEKKHGVKNERRHWDRNGRGV